MSPGALRCGTHIGGISGPPKHIYPPPLPADTLPAPITSPPLKGEIANHQSLVLRERGQL